MLYVTITAAPKAGGSPRECIKNYPVDEALNSSLPQAIQEANKICPWDVHDYDIEIRHSEKP